MQLFALVSLLASASALHVAPMAAPPRAVSRAAQPAMAFEWFTEAGGAQGQKHKAGEVRRSPIPRCLFFPRGPPNRIPTPADCSRATFCGVRSLVLSSRVASWLVCDTA